MTVKDLTENFLGTIYVFEDNFLAEPHAIVECDSPVLELLADKEVISWTVRCHSKKPMINIAIDMTVEDSEDNVAGDEDTPVEDSDETLDTEDTEQTNTEEE